MTARETPPRSRRIGAQAGLDRVRSESPWRRALRSLLKKRVAVVSLLAIVVIYGAGTYTFLDAFGAPTGLQDPTKTNLTLRRPIREGELLGNFVARHGVSVETAARLNPELADEAGPFTEATLLPDGTQLVLQLDAALQPPSAEHWFGTDRTGRDLFSQALFSARTTIVMTIIVFLLGSLFMGLGLGLLAGYAGGWIDQLIMRIGDVILGIPGLLVLIVVSSAFRSAGPTPSPTSTPSSAAASSSSRASTTSPSWSSPSPSSAGSTPPASSAPRPSPCARPTSSSPPSRSARARRASSCVTSSRASCPGSSWGSRRPSPAWPAPRSC